METHLHQKFCINVEGFKQKNALRSVTVAISGGQDSLCLMKLIQDFKTYYQPSLKISYVYIDHQWKKDSKSHLAHIINFMNLFREKIYVYQTKHISNSETNARKLRYQLLIKHSIYSNNNVIATAHTATDQIETFWQQLIRGSTLNGITSLTSKRIFDNNIQLWRPLINFSRNEICWFCRKFYLPIWSDSTNYSYIINRNRLRNELIPYLNKYFQYNLDKQIHKFVHNSNIDNEYIKQNTIKLYLISRHKKSMAINYQIIKQQHMALQTRILQLFIYHNLNQLLSQEILYKLIIDVKHMITVNQKKVALKNINIGIYKHWLYIY